MIDFIKEEKPEPTDVITWECPVCKAENKSRRIFFEHKTLGVGCRVCRSIFQGKKE